MPMPVSWGKKQVEFYLNDGSRCADSTLDDLIEQAERWRDTTGECYCDKMRHEYLGPVEDS